LQAVGHGLACCIVVVHNQNAPFHSHSPGKWGQSQGTPLDTN
jgi:hypothetical protein